MGKEFLRQLWAFKSSIVMIATPFLLLPIPILYATKAGRCAYAIAIMAVYWMTEVVPMAATALLPIALMPWLGVIGSKQLCLNYLKDTNMLFVGGLLVAVAVEKWNLHKRIALRVLLLVGSKPRWLMFGFMITTAFLSMWLSNTATTAMMIPIVEAVLLELEKHNDDVRARIDAESAPLARESGDGLPEEKLGNGHIDNHFTDKVSPKSKLDYVDANGDVPKVVIANGGPEKHNHHRVEDSTFRKMAKGLTLSVAYAANIGGTATLTGTGPNLIVKGQLDTIYGSGHGINFSSWFIFAFPNMVLCLILCWLCLQVMFLGCRETFPCCFKSSNYDDTAAAVLRKEYEKLGPMTFAEAAVLGHFIILATLWLTREPEFVPGWSYFFEDGYVTDACVVITVSFFLFMFPSQPPNFMCCKQKGDTRDPEPAPPLLDWETVHKKLAWSVIIVLGGGFALADACKESGLSQDIGDVLQSFSEFPGWAMVALLSVLTAVFTGVTSNVATATIFLPILAQLAVSIGLHPLYLMLPVTIACSLAFVLPVSTPPNAIVFAYGRLKIIDMFKAGSVITVICVLVLQLCIGTWTYAYFGFGTFPEWALEVVLNTTATQATPVNCSIAI